MLYHCIWGGRQTGPLFRRSTALVGSGSSPSDLRESDPRREGPPRGPGYRNPFYRGTFGRAGARTHIGPPDWRSGVRDTVK